MNIKKDIREKLSIYLDEKLDKGDPYIFNEAVNFIKKYRKEQLIAFAEWKEYSGKHQTHKEQVEAFLKQNK
ncbi:hypothetical protein Harreka1_67 [Olleya phage Harreka_1]|uniref:Uncharacterized protein n=1 Tax=Olleya phage Harreka_1 TaxID=2745673 RepID=A0A8E5EAU1_9CAUD|nr:hypothetical protein M1M26_gp67 [Olleya phage Harreka_1]QQV90474.1 hypothetical protein Harreka1_67 [Olleya phage Harreka_1]